MYRYIFISYCFVLLCTAQATLFAVDASTNTKRAMLIFIDDYEFMGEKKGGPTFDSLMAAINQQVGPIIASRSLIANLASRYFIHTNEIIDKVDRVIEGKEQPFDDVDLRIQAANFNPEQWIIKEINTFLYLLIPIQYLEQLGIDSIRFNTFEFSSKPTNEELNLGIKINHMKTISLEEIKELPATGNYFIAALSNPLGSTSELFCLNNQYLKDTSIHPPQWAFYIVGHGLPGKMIVGLSIDAFRYFLNFIATKITTSLLAYTSCYATGLNAEIIYKNAQSAVQTIYPYAIIANAINDSLVKASAVIKISNKIPQFFVEKTANFKQFLKEASNPDAIDYRAIAKSLFINFSDEQIPHLPQIKLPGLEWFSVLADNKEFFSIGKNLAASRTTPLNINSYTHGKPKIILIHANYIPFEIIIDKPTTEAIISMAPGVAQHVIDKISSPITLRYIVRLFTYPKPGLRKSFLIKEIQINSQFLSERTTIQNVLFDYDPFKKEWATNYTIGNNLFTHNGAQQKLVKKAQADDVAAYKKQWQDMSLILQNQFTPSNIAAFDFSTALKKRLEQESREDELYELQNQLNILQAMQKISGIL